MKYFLALVLSVSVAGCESAPEPAYHGATIGDAPYKVLQTWTVTEHNYEKNEYTFTAHNTKDSPKSMEAGLTVKIVARCAAYPDQNVCPFYTGQVLKVSNAVDSKADDSWDEEELGSMMWFVQGKDVPTHSFHYFEIIKEEAIR